MDRMVRDSVILAVRTMLACGVLCTALCSASAQITITENPEGAVKLRRIWFIKGWGSVDTIVGSAAGGIGDVNSDHYDDFCVQVRTDWHLFLGGEEPISTIPAWTHRSSALRVDNVSPVVGDFLGNGIRLVGLSDALCNPNNGVCLIRVYFYRPDVDSLLKSTPYLLELNEQPNNFALHAGDLDRDGADELVVVNTQNDSTRVRIYRGGADFSLSAPTMTLTTVSVVFSSILDLDGDGFRDLYLGSNEGIPRQRFWWGAQGSPWNWEELPHRVLDRPVGRKIAGYSSVTPWPKDYNGDGVMDLGGNQIWADSMAFSLWLSGPDKDFRTRPFDSTDVDMTIENVRGGGTLGFVADSLGRYHMLPIEGEALPSPDHYGLGGGAAGPNRTYDVWVSSAESPSGGGRSAGDVNNDGWEDRLMNSAEYGGPGVGIAAIFAGGPYIPSDDPTVDVREIATDEHERAIHVWPNPVDEELRLAWRGDLRRQPARLLVHSMTGKDVADIPLHYWIGQARWSRGDASPGAYIITVLDTNGETLATTPIILR